jgi:branched-chain amino acid transport system substrate-binding protein
MKKTFLLAAVSFAVATAVSATAGARPSATPGVTSKSILLEGTFPLSGPASSYAPIPAAMGAYFAYVNAHGGVSGRKINWRYDDDGYNPANTVQLTHKYVEQDHAFALVGGLGTEPQLAVRQYLNANKVPALFVSTGATTFDRDYGQYPWTIGWQPDYEAEGSIYGKYAVKNLSGSKIAVLYQNDDYGGDYLRGLKAGLGSHASMIVDAESYDPTATSVAPQMLKLRASGADTFAIFGLPSPTITAYATATKIGWHPAHVFCNSVSATDPFLTLAEQKYGSDIVEGTLSVNYLLDPANTRYSKQPGMALYRTIMSKYDPKANANDILNMYGVAKAWTTVQLLKKLGANPTRAGLVKAARGMAFTAGKENANPFLLPGVSIFTRGTFQYPISQVNVVRYTNHAFQPLGNLIAGRGALR